MSPPRPRTVLADVDSEETVTAKLRAQDTLAPKLFDDGKTQRWAPPPKKEASQGKSGWAIGAFAHFSTIYASLVGLTFSVAAVSWSRRPLEVAGGTGVGGTPPDLHAAFDGTLVVNFYSVVLHVFLFAGYFFIPPLKKSGTRFMIILRGIVLASLAAPLWTSYFLIFPAVCLTCISLLYALSALRKESGVVVKPGMTIQKNLWRGGSGGLQAWIRKQRARQVFGRVFVITLWLAINVGLFIYNYDRNVKDWNAIMALSPEDKDAKIPCVTTKSVKFTDECYKIVDTFASWLPIAKGFGLCLDFNCALIMLLVTQSVIRRLHEWRLKRGIMYYVCGWMPVHKTNLFHKYLAAAIFLQSVGHTLGHLMCLSYTLPIWMRSTPNTVGQIDGVGVTLSVWATGLILLFVLIFMYAMSMKPCREMMFEVFINTHKLGALIFMGSLFWHSTIFWLFGLVPCVIYIVDVWNRQYAGRFARSQLLEVTYTPPVINLVFNSSIAYNVGQYVFLKCPWVSKYQAHAFTISSAPETGLLTLHIKVFPGGWTEKVKDFLFDLVKECEATGDGHMEPAPVKDGFFFKFGYLDPVTSKLVHGKSTWRGLPMFEIDGPLSAPAVHWGQYETTIIAAAGIGLTPIHAIMTCLTNFAWKQRPDATTAKTKNLYVVWLCRQQDISAYRWFLKSVFHSELAMQFLPDFMASEVHLEIHLFATSCAPAVVDITPAKPVPQEITIDGRNVIRPYLPEELQAMMQNPQIESTQFASLMQSRIVDQPNCVGQTRVWKGRPVWDELYARVKARHASPASPGESAHKVGVFFCGTTAIARDLQLSSVKLSDATCAFEVMKEIF